MDALEASGCYDPDDGFFYDLLTDASGASTLDPGADPGRGDPGAARDRRSAHPWPNDSQGLRKRFARRLEHKGRHQMLDWRVRGTGDTRRLLLSVVPPDQLRRILATLFDEDAFLSPHGLRVAVQAAQHALLGTRPARARRSSTSPPNRAPPCTAGNSNWRGPVWFPINYLVIRALLQYDQFLGAGLHPRVPDRIRAKSSLRDIAGDLSDRLVGIWLPDADGRRPVYGGGANAADRPGVEGQPAVLRVLPRRQRRRPRRDAPDRLDRPGRRPDPRPTPVQPAPDLRRAGGDGRTRNRPAPATPNGVDAITASPA